jgi:hypothetical protein
MHIMYHANIILFDVMILIEQHLVKSTIYEAAQTAH